MTVKLNLGGVVIGANRDTLSFGSTRYYTRHAGQFIYGKQNFFNGSMAIVPDYADGKATSGDVPAMDIHDIDSDFLMVNISRPSYYKSKEAAASGTGSKRIHQKTLQEFTIFVPGTEEQSKIGALFGKLDALIAANQFYDVLTKTDVCRCT